MTDKSLVAILTGQLFEIFARVAEEKDLPPVVASAFNDDFEAYISFARRPRTSPASPSTAPTSCEDAILEALRAAAKVIPTKTLAARAGYAYSSRFRGVLAELVRAGKIVRTPDGYRPMPNQ